MANSTADMGDLAITFGTVEPGSSLEEHSIASGIPAASLDIYHSDDDAEKHAGEHSYGGSQTP